MQTAVTLPLGIRMSQTSDPPATEGSYDTSRRRWFGTNGTSFGDRPTGTKDGDVDGD